MHVEWLIKIVTQGFWVTYVKCLKKSDWGACGLCMWSGSDSGLVGYVEWLKKSASQGVMQQFDVPCT